MAKLVLRLLGQTEAKLDDNRIDAFPADKVTALLSYLAVESGVAHARTTLAVLLWPEHSARKAQGNLRQTLYRLRTTLDQHAPGLSDELLTVTRRTIRLEPNSLLLDVAEVLHWSAKAAELQQGVPLEPYRAAADLVRGEFMAGLTLKDAPEFDEWQTVMRERCFTRGQSLLYALAQRYIQEENYPDAIRLARRQLELDPWREEAHRQLMNALARSGRPHDALAQYEACRQMLLDEWGDEPSDATVALYEAIRDRTIVPAEPAPLESPPRPPTISNTLHGFPQQSIAFIGRTRELNLTLSYFEQPNHRLMTIVSVGGMGRRRLALEAARQLVQDAERFQHGAVYVPLAQVTSPEAALAGIANALDINYQGGAPTLDQLVHHLRSLNLLLVFSDLECLVDARAIVSAILSGTKQVCILATSVNGIKLPGERTLVLSGLELDRPKSHTYHDRHADAHPHSTSAGDAPELSSSTQMFVAVAQKYRPTWTPTAADRTWIARICELVDGMPLALSIAAGWTRVMDLPSIARELDGDDNLGQLADEDEWGRPRSVRAVYEDAWQHLPEPTQLALAQASLFQNGATVQAIYAVTQTDRQTLAVLVDRGLLRWHDNGRTGMVRLQQQLARQKLRQTPDLERAAIERFVAYYLGIVQEANDLLLGVVNDDDWLARIVAELDNIRQAWRWAVEYTDLVAATDLFHVVGLSFERSAHYQDALNMIEVCLARVDRWQTDASHSNDDPAFQSAKEADLSRLVGVLNAEKGWFLWRLNRYADARVAVTQSLARLPEAGKPRDLSFAYLTQALIDDSQGKYVDARATYARCLHICEADGDRVRTGRVLNFLGAMTRILGDFDEAVRLHEQSLAIGRHLSDRWGIASTLHNLGIALQELGRIRRARALYHEAVRASTSLGDPWAIHVAKTSWADLEIDAQEYDAANQLLQDALEWADDAGNLWAAALATTVQGRLERITDDPLQAENTLSHALDLWRRVGDQRGMVRTLGELGRAALAQQRYTASAELLTRALESSAALETNALSAEILAGLARLLAESNQPQRARRIATFLRQYQAASSRVRTEIDGLLADSLAPAHADEPQASDDAPGADATLAQIVCLAQEAAASLSPLPPKNLD